MNVQEGQRGRSCLVVNVRRVGMGSRARRAPCVCMERATAADEGPVYVYARRDGEARIVTLLAHQEHVRCLTVQRPWLSFVAAMAVARMVYASARWALQAQHASGAVPTRQHLTMLLRLRTVALST